jgi:cystinosin
VLLDFTGGLLSLAQLLMDCGVKGDWSGIEGDPVKFGLGLVSMVFDVVFMLQHYVLFRGEGEGAAAEGQRRAGGKGGALGLDDMEGDEDEYAAILGYS